MSVPRNVELKQRNGPIKLRPPGMDIAPDIYDAVVVSKDELMPWMEWCRPDYSIEITLDWLRNAPLEWEQGTNYQFVILDDQDDQFLGSCGLNHINQYYLLANLGYWVRSDRTGEGIATEATKLVAKFGFQELGLQRIEIITAVENWGSRRVATKAGATFEAILRNRIKIGGRYIDAAMHSLIPADLQ